MTHAEKMAMLSATLENLVTKHNEAREEKKFDTMVSLDVEIKNTLKDYNETAEKAAYLELNKYENPLAAAALTGFFDGKKIEEIKREDGSVEGYAIATKSIAINLKKVTDSLNLKKDWFYKLEQFNQTLCLKKGDELGIPKKSQRDAIGSLHISKVVKRLDAGENPLSNNQLCKNLQEIVDLIIYEDNEKGKNKFRCNNHDVAWLYGCYGKYSKNVRRAIKPFQTKVLATLLSDVISRIITNDNYVYEGSKEVSMATKAAKKAKDMEALELLPLKKVSEVSKEANEETKEDGKVSEETNDEK